MVNIKDEFEIGTKLPYYAVRLTFEEAELIKGKTITIYETDGKFLFSVRDENGNLTGEMIFFVMFN